MGPHVAHQNGFLKKDDGGISEIERMESEGEPSHISLEKHSILILNQAKKIVQVRENLKTRVHLQEI